jgi:hypothetical protein
MKLGTNDIGSVYLGTNAVQKVYLGANEVWSAVDPDAQAFFDRVTTAGGSLSTTEQDAVNTLVVQMKADGIWTKMKAIYPMVGASAAACAQNLKSSSFTGTFSAGQWTFASTGVQSPSANGHMNTGLLATTNLSTSSAHLSVYINTAPNGQQFLANGALSGFLQTNGGKMYGSLAGSFITTSTTENSAFYMVNRQSSSNLKLIKNNSILLSSSNTGSGYAANNFLLNAYTTTNNINNCRYAFASIGDGLTDDEALDFYNALQAFNTTLSRNN